MHNYRCGHKDLADTHEQSINLVEDKNEKIVKGSNPGHVPLYAMPVFTGLCRSMEASMQIALYSVSQKKHMIIFYAVASQPTAGRLVRGLSDRLSVG